MATLQDFSNFHGMLCRPATAQKCINSFGAGGTVLFLPNHYTFQSLSEYDCSHVLTSFTYYTLVMFSLTGLLTLLGQTKFLICREEKEDEIIMQSGQNKRIVAISNPGLVIEPYVLDYIATRTTTGQRRREQDDKILNLLPQFVIKRRFEFDFGGFASVMMIHLGQHDVSRKQQQEEEPEQHGKNNKLHLIEVYRIHNPVLRCVFSHLLSAMGRALRFSLFFLGLQRQRDA